VKCRCRPGLRTHLAIVALGVPLVLAPSTRALASWSTGGSGDAAGAAAVMPTGAAPSGTVAGSSVTVRWNAATFPNGVDVSGYVITRSQVGSGAPATVGAGCNGVVTSTTCTELSVPAGSWVYSETPVQSGWTGGTSPDSPPIVVP
jgi:hypothetical protein